MAQIRAVLLRLSAAGATLAAALAGAPPAAADDVWTEVATLAFVADGPARAVQVGFLTRPASLDGDAGCNLERGESVTLAVHAEPEGVVAVSPAQLVFPGPGCNPRPLTVRPQAVGSATITFSEVANTSRGSLTTTTGVVRVTVSAPRPADTTPPIIRPAVRADPPLGPQGWAQGRVELSWEVTDPETGVASSLGCGAVVVDADQAETAYECEAVNGAGQRAQGRATLKRDGSPPRLAPLSTAPPGWTNRPFVAEFSCVDEGPSGVGAFDGAAVTLTASGTAEASCVDHAGNRATAALGPVLVDLDPPLNRVQGATEGEVLLAPPTLSCTTGDGDGGSGVAASAALDVTRGGPNGVGEFRAVCSGGADAAGNPAAPAAVSFHVHYPQLGELAPPFTRRRAALLRREQAAPLRFTLPGGRRRGFDTGAWALERVPAACATGAELGPAAAVPAPFAYDADSSQYSTRLTLPDAPLGSCWRVRVRLDSGQTLESATIRVIR